MVCMCAHVHMYIYLYVQCACMCAWRTEVVIFWLGFSWKLSLTDWVDLLELQLSFPEPTLQARTVLPSLLHVYQESQMPIWKILYQLNHLFDFYVDFILYKFCIFWYGYSLYRFQFNYYQIFIKLWLWKVTIFF